MAVEKTFFSPSEYCTPVAKEVPPADSDANGTSTALCKRNHAPQLVETD